ncbi:MAG TPA: hypothetical protein VMZ53_33465 [Kofleriaceae bacterium]|nr:hypothetical protein [Kofleriaceae bacterium]
MKRALRVIAVLGAAAIAACFTKPGEPHLTDGGNGTRDAGPDGVGMDGRGDGPDAPPSGCGTQDDFNVASVMDCQDWGDAVVSTGTTITRLNGTLDFNFTGTSSSASCTTKTAFNITNGTSIRIVEPSNYQTSFSLTVSGKTVTYVLTYTGTMYSAVLICPTGGTSNASAPLIAGPPAWIQMKVSVPGAGGLTVALETSPSGNLGTWTQFQTCTFTAAAATTGIVEMRGSGSGATYTKFDDFNMKNCPPPL